MTLKNSTKLPVLRYLDDCNVLHIPVGVSVPSLPIESTDSMIIPMYMTVWFGSVSMEYYHNNYYCPVVQLEKSHIKRDSPCSTYNTLDATCTSDSELGLY